jgi:DNA-binding LacI/PurR family transcriptional regulator
LATTIRDVAKHAGVARSTVSYVLTGNRPVSVATRERVERSIRELKFRPHAGARSIRASHTGVVGLAVPFREGTSSRVRMDFISSIAESANRHGIDVLLLTAEHGNAQIERVIASAMVDGLILMDVDLHDDRIPLVAELGKPAVLIGMPDQPYGLPYVDLDMAAAGRLSAQYLIELGHRRIGLLGCRTSFYEHGVAFIHRSRAGFLEVLKAHNLPGAFEPIEPTPNGVEEALRNLFSRSQDLTAIVVHNDMAVSAVVDALKRSFRDIPRDLSLIALCPEDVANEQSPVLTHVALPAVELGRRAVELLVAQDNGMPVSSTLIEPRLHPRASTAPPRPAGLG